MIQRNRRNRCWLIVAILLIAAGQIQGAEAEQTDDSLKTESAASPSAASSALSPLVTKVLHQSGTMSQSDDLKGTGNPFDSLAGNKLSEVLLKAGEKYGGLAKTVTGTVGDYVKEKQIFNVQQKLTRNFYANFYRLAENLALNDEEYSTLVTRVAGIYIEDGKTGRYGLDAVNLSELPAVIKKEYADIVLARTQDGIVDTFYINGALKTRWNLKAGRPEGDVVTYYDDGEIRTIDIYTNGKKVVRKKYDHDGKLEFEQNYSYGLPEKTGGAENKENEGLVPVGATAELSPESHSEKSEIIEENPKTLDARTNEMQH